MNGPKVWKALHDVVAPVYGAAVIAGGSPRDYVVHHNIKPKDFDIFVPVADELALESAIPDLNFHRLQLMEPGKTYPLSPNIIGVLAGYTWDTNLKINIIGKRPEAIADPNLLMADFDHSLCQFWVNPVDHKEVFRTEAADLTLRTGVVEIYGDDRRTKTHLTNLTGRAKSYERFTFEGKGEQLQRYNTLTDTLLGVESYLRPVRVLQPVMWEDNNMRWELRAPMQMRP